MELQNGGASIRSEKTCNNLFGKPVKLVLD